jgi:hypothetical protein
MNKTENTLYILQNLSSTESKDLDYAEIDVYYEDEQGNEGAAQYDMPTIADDAISTINELQDKIAELESNILMLEQYNGSVESLIKDIEAHNLEQHDKGFDVTPLNTRIPEFRKDKS